MVRDLPNVQGSHIIVNTSIWVFQTPASLLKSSSSMFYHHLQSNLEILDAFPIHPLISHIFHWRTKIQNLTFSPTSKDSHLIPSFSSTSTSWFRFLMIWNDLNWIKVFAICWIRWTIHFNAKLLNFVFKSRDLMNVQIPCCLWERRLN